MESANGTNTQDRRPPRKTHKAPDTASPDAESATPACAHAATVSPPHHTPNSSLNSTSNDTSHCPKDKMSLTAYNTCEPSFSPVHLLSLKTPTNLISALASLAITGIKLPSTMRHKVQCSLRQQEEFEMLKQLLRLDCLDLQVCALYLLHETVCFGQDLIRAN